MSQGEAHNAAVEAVTDQIFGAEEPTEEASTELVEAQDEASEVEEQQEEQQEVEQEEDQEEGPALYEVQIGDAIYEVPEEIKAELDKAQDYTSKTQSVSAERKAVEALRAQAQIEADEQTFLAEVTPEVTDLRLKQSQVEQWKQYKRENVDNLDVAGLYKIDLQISELNEGIAAIKESVTLKYNERQQAREQDLQSLSAKSTEALKSKIPGWSDDHKAQAREIGLAAGFTEAELDQAQDPREWEILWKAAQYDRLQANKGMALKKVQSAPQIKPKARRSEAQQRQTERLNVRNKIRTAKGKEQRDLIQDDISRRLGL